MTVQLSVAARNNRLDSIETTVGASPVLEIRSGSQPANCAAADSGTLIASLALPSDFMAAAAAGVKAKSGTWEDTAANASGTAAHWRLKSSGGTVHAQGSVGLTGSGADLELDAVAIVAAQDVLITAWTFTDGNA